MKIHNINDLCTTVNKEIVFITGVTGQDGSHMADYILQNTDFLVVGGARRLSVENHVNIKHLENHPRFNLVNFDLTDSHSIYKLVELLQPKYFINFAAQSFVASSWDFAKQTWETNSTSVLDCLEAIHRFKPDCRFYNAGSSEEFGDVIKTPQDETHPARPRSPYGASKSAARTLVKVYRESYGLYAVQGWLFNHEGERRGEEFVTRKITQNVVRIANEVKHGIPNPTVVELGNINAKRDWSYAPDFMDGIWRMLNQDKYNEDLALVRNDMMEIYKTKYTKWLSQKISDYVLASGETHTIREFVEKSFSHFNIKGEWVGEGINEHLIINKHTTLVRICSKFYRPAEVDILLGDSSRARKELGWKPKTSFDELVKIMVDSDSKLIER